MSMEKYNKKFSIAHWDRTRGVIQDDFADSWFLDSLSNSTEQYRNEIYDIYFGGQFLHRDVSYGETMGVTPSRGQYKNLLKIQEKFGIPISLTFNEMTRPFYLLRIDVMKEFLECIQKYYDDGVRSCTISHTHLMRTGALQERFPDMVWKNTVNHRIRSTQEFLDYTKLGYNIIQLDRDFNRNLNELKWVKKEADRVGVKTCLLISENCMPECPFKVEHDIWQGGREFRDLSSNYWEAIDTTCVKWRDPANNRTKDNSGVNNPRAGTDIIMNDKKTWDDFTDLVDVFKVSGRLVDAQQIDKRGARWFSIPVSEKGKTVGYAEGTDRPTNQIYLEIPDFKTAYDNDLTPLSLWIGQVSISNRVLKENIITDIDRIHTILEEHFWNTEIGRDLAKTLKQCRNQCYRCHKCDNAFETGEIDSILDL